MTNEEKLKEAVRVLEEKLKVAVQALVTVATGEAAQAGYSTKGHEGAVLSARDALSVIEGGLATVIHNRVKPCRIFNVHRRSNAARRSTVYSEFVTCPNCLKVA